MRVREEVVDAGRCCRETLARRSGRVRRKWVAVEMVEGVRPLGEERGWTERGSAAVRITWLTFLGFGFEIPDSEQEECKVGVVTKRWWSFCSRAVSESVSASVSASASAPECCEEDEEEAERSTAILWILESSSG